MEREAHSSTNDEALRVIQQCAPLPPPLLCPLSLNKADTPDKICKACSDRVAGGLLICSDSQNLPERTRWSAITGEAHHSLDLLPTRPCYVQLKAKPPSSCRRPRQGACSSAGLPKARQGKTTCNNPDELQPSQSLKTTHVLLSLVEAGVLEPNTDSQEWPHRPYSFKRASSGTCLPDPGSNI